MSTPKIPEYELRRQMSYRILEEARTEAVAARKYDSARERARLQSLFLAKHGTKAYEWQLDVEQAVSLGLDCTLVTGTGMGKTIPFMLILLPEEKRRIVVVSPLKVLQRDQADRFNSMGLAAAAINGDTWNRKKLREVQSARFEFSKNVTALIIDEAHCISQWGGDFRKAYAELDKIRALFPPNIPVLYASATLNATALQDVRKTMNIDPEHSFHLNLDNDRPNILTEVHCMKNAKDFDALLKHLDMHPSDPSQIKKTLVFTNAVHLTQSLCQQLKQKHPDLPPGSIDFLHANRSKRDKKKAMKRFRDGDIRILFATEAVGMGTDIADIQVVIHFGVLRSLSVFLQRIGRAGRLRTIKARAILLVEESMFQRQRKRKGKSKKKSKLGEDDSEAEEVDDDLGTPLADEEADLYQWRKKVQPVLRRWIVARCCPRDICDKYYGNPPRTGIFFVSCILRITDALPTAPTGICCDRPGCKRNITANMVVDSPRPQTPPNRTLERVILHLTPSKTVNGNGKRDLVSAGPSVRRGEHLKAARSSLENWRIKTSREPRYSFLPTIALMPDTIITQIASNVTLKAPSDLAELNPPWMLAERHGAEVLQ
ncbi:P-loop containing nucleoside triphosphate hydrolase protein [Mycena floridula]|nr:P-loop containing nucleoside triphosphate hydrolase protein [Mycena floridula]